VHSYKQYLSIVSAALFVGLVGCSTVDVPTVVPVAEEEAPKQQVVAEFTPVDSSNSPSNSSTC